MHKSLKALLVVLGLAVIVAAAYMIISDTSFDRTVNIPEGWEEYSTSTLSINHPPEAEITSEMGAVKIQVFGPDIIENSEVTDGFTLFVQTEDIPQDSSLSEVAQESYDAETEQLQGVQEPTQTRVGERNAYMYQIESELGSASSILFIEAQDNNAFRVSYTIADPNDVGYENTVNAILQTLRFNN